MKTTTPNEIAAKLKAGETIDLIDVRMPVEFREVHAEGARSVPLDSLDPRALMSQRNGSSGTPLYLMCRSGNRSKMACEKFAAAGYDDIINVEGGTAAWEAAGLPVVRGKKAVSLERQVRILAGFLVLVGAVLCLFVHPWFIGLSAFIGAGLMFAGITNTCGMGMMLAKMPWNRCDEESANCSV